ncbi:hypothetical protein [Polymorphobacter sp.]|uniref:hypothetical protein n=1 Tax=Polymorphobacter sp. TaxID=1909290 RepID=UPI003F6F7BAF
MNPYDATMRNAAARIGVWLYGMARLYRRPLMIMALASATMVASVSATSHQAPVAPDIQPTN